MILGFCFKCSQPSRNLVEIIVRGRAGSRIKRKICTSCNNARQKIGDGKKSVEQRPIVLTTLKSRKCLPPQEEYGNIVFPKDIS